MFIAAFTIFGLTSCKKDWTCECTTTTGGISATSSSTIYDASKSDATDACNDLNEVNTIFTRNCKIR